MIKVNCKDGSEPLEEKYPCLKKSVHFGNIVLFTAPGIGYELDGGRCSTDFHYSHSWIEEDFRLYTGTIELSNELKTNPPPALGNLNQYLHPTRCVGGGKL